MLENIKSTFFIRIIFNQIGIKIKFKLVRHNKSLQNKININIIDYKVVSNRCIKYISNNEWYEYYLNRNEFIYSGEILNGLRNGHGEEYDGVIRKIFEGTYLNGKRNGYGREYSDLRQILFEGEYKNGKKWNGKGFSYFESEYYSENYCFGKKTNI